MTVGATLPGGLGCVHHRIIIHFIIGVMDNGVAIGAGDDGVLADPGAVGGLWLACVTILGQTFVPVYA